MQKEDEMYFCTLYLNSKKDFFSYILQLICFIFLQYALRCSVYSFHTLQKKKKKIVRGSFWSYLLKHYSEIIILFQKGTFFQDEAVFFTMRILTI